MEIELNEFRKLFNGFTVGLRDLKELEGNIKVIDILNPYKLKILPKNVEMMAKNAEITNFKVIHGKNTDLFFVQFELSRKALTIIERIFKPSDRSYRKYKVEFSKKERSLLWKLKNKPQNVHKDIYEEDGVPAWENQPQKFLSEAEWRFNLYLERKRKRKITVNYIKTLRKVGDVETWSKWERVVKLYS